MLIIISGDNLNSEEVFNDGEGNFLYRCSINTLKPGEEIDVQVIDAYIAILNYEEKFKFPNKTRHFFYTSMMVWYPEKHQPFLSCSYKLSSLFINHIYVTVAWNTGGRDNKF